MSDRDRSLECVTYLVARSIDENEHNGMTARGSSNAGCTRFLYAL